MKYLLIIAAFLMAGISGSVFAQAHYNKGTVRIGHWSGNTPEIDFEAFMNVRYNTSVTNAPFVYVVGHAYSIITIGGRDDKNQQFSCYVMPGSPLYQAAVDVMHNLRNGSYLSVWKMRNENACKRISLGQASFMLD